MVVKSATKKRLMELGVSEEFAHKLATDRNMTDIKAMSSDEVASTLGVSKDSEQFTKRSCKCHTLDLGTLATAKGNQANQNGPKKSPMSTRS